MRTYERRAYSRPNDLRKSLGLVWGVFLVILGCCRCKRTNPSCVTNPVYTCTSLVLFVNLFVPPAIIHPSKSLVTERTLVRPIPVVAPLVPAEVDLPRKVLAADVAGEPRGPPRGLPTAQRLEDGGALAHLGVVDADVAVLVLVGREADGRRAAGHGARERPVVPVLVALAGRLGLVAHVEVAAEGPGAFEEVGAVEVSDVPLAQDLVVGPVLLQSGPVFKERGVDLRDADLVSLFIFAVLMDVDAIPQDVEAVIQGRMLILFKVADVKFWMWSGLHLFAMCVDEQSQSYIKITLLPLPNNRGAEQVAAFSDEGVDVGVPFGTCIVLEGEPAGFGMVSSLG